MFGFPKTSPRGWIGVDFDGTIAKYDPSKGIEHLGAPIASMVERVRGWLRKGYEVRIVTARVGFSGDPYRAPAADELMFAALQRKLIEEWCVREIGMRLAVTASKDFGMIELWDDRAVQVQVNTGVPLGVSSIDG